jgi:hypothetical protein
MTYTIAALTPAQETFRERLEVQLTDNNAIDILNISVGHIFDLLCDEVENEEFEEVIRGYTVNITVATEPDSVIINCGDYKFEFDGSLADSIISYGYFSDENVGQLAVVNAVAAMLDALLILLAGNGTEPCHLQEQWDG